MEFDFEPAKQLSSDPELAKATARCFRGQDGERVLQHLRSITLLRALGPQSSDNMLRHIEGQRQLVTYIGGLIERGRNPNTYPPITGDTNE